MYAADEMCLVGLAPIGLLPGTSLTRSHRGIMSDYLLMRTDWADVSLERETENVPHDGRFHVLVGGKIVKSLRSQKAALQAYKEAIKATGKVPPPKENGGNASQTLQAEENQRQFYLSAMYWAVSHDYSKPEKLRK